MMVPPEIEVVVIDNGAKAMEIVNVALADWLVTVSETVIDTSVKVPAAAGVPLIVPVERSRLKPGGRVDDVH